MSGRDLIAFIAILSFGFAMILVKVSPSALAMITAALGGMYAAWRRPPGPD